MAIANNLAVSRWIEMLLTGKRPMSKGRSAHYLSMSGSSVLAEDNGRIYSYGRHFEMARPLRTKSGKLRAMLLNGDQSTTTTTQHQGMVRAAARQMDVPIIIVPYAALTAASIDFDSIEPVEIRPDRTTVHQHSSEERPGALLHMDDPTGTHYIEKNHISGTLDKETDTFYWREVKGYDHENNMRPIYIHRTMPVDAEHPDEITIVDEAPFPPKPSITLDTDGEAWRKWGERYTEFSRQWVPVWRPVQVDNPDKCYVGRSQYFTANRDENGIWRWETSRHWLGDSCFRAKVREEIIHEEWGPAFESGSAAWEAGWSTLRTRHPEGLTSPAKGGFGFNATSTFTNRTRYFLSSFDYQEARPLYFLCELPRSKRPTSVEHAYELLKPKPVLRADEFGMSYTRQGDVFAVECPNLTTRDVKATLIPGEAIVKRRHVLGTEHSCTEVAICRMPVGPGDKMQTVTLGRGVMYHDVGAFRERDHARRRMADGKTWHLLVRNTVPRQR